MNNFGIKLENLSIRWNIVVWNILEIQKKIDQKHS